jgi:hypothetical protein
MPPNLGCYREPVTDGFDGGSPPVVRFSEVGEVG